MAGAARGCIRRSARLWSGQTLRESRLWSQGQRSAHVHLYRRFADNGGAAGDVRASEKSRGSRSNAGTAQRVSDAAPFEPGTPNNKTKTLHRSPGCDTDHTHKPKQEWELGSLLALLRSNSTPLVIYPCDPRHIRAIRVRFFLLRPITRFLPRSLFAMLKSSHTSCGLSVSSASHPRDPCHVFLLDPITRFFSPPS